MSFADLTYYRDTYNGRTVSDDDELQRLLDRAAQDLELYLGETITLTDYETDQQTALKNANCAQAEYMSVNGDGLDSFDSFSLGQFSISSKSSAQSMIGGLSKRAYQYLLIAGLSFRGIRCSRYRAEY